MNVFFVVTVLESKEKTRGDKYFPYELHGYENICNLKLSTLEISGCWGLIIKLSIGLATMTSNAIKFSSSMTWKSHPFRKSFPDA
jgi:hypothetical protein